MKGIMALFFAIIFLGVGYGADRKVIYGTDNRVDLPLLKNERFKVLGKSTAAMVAWSKLKPIGSDCYEFPFDSLRQVTGICRREKYSSQATIASCSGFLVGPDILVTAGHCVQNDFDCQDNAWVFDYTSDRPFRNRFQGKKIYRCQEILDRQFDHTRNIDYAILRLERKVPDRSPLKFRRQGAITNRAPLAVIGHPSGLPTKYADGAKVRKNNNPYYFVANLDTFAGNSGSPVFDANTGEVEGILVRGESDYIRRWYHFCYRSKRCADDSCSGEEVTRIGNANLERFVD